MLSLIRSGQYALSAIRSIRFKTPEKQIGATAIEYALIAGLIAVVIIGGATLLGGNIDEMFNFIAGKIETPSE